MSTAALHANGQNASMETRPGEPARRPEAAVAGRSQSARELLPSVYRSLRELAERQMRQERPGHTLGATALVHEAFLRLVGDGTTGWDNRAHFYAAAAEAMRRILVEHARRVGAKKRGGGWNKELA